MTEGTQPTPLNNAEQMTILISQLQEKLKTAAPGYEHLLHTIHVNLHKDEELVHFLSEDQIGIVVQALAQRKNIVISADAKGGKAAGGKKLKDLTAGDL